MIRGVTDTNERPQVMNNRSATVMLGLEGMAGVLRRADATRRRAAPHPGPPAPHSAARRPVPGPDSPAGQRASPVTHIDAKSLAADAAAPAYPMWFAADGHATFTALSEAKSSRDMMAHPYRAKHCIASSSLSSLKASTRIRCAEGPPGGVAGCGHNRRA